MSKPMHRQGSLHRSVNTAHHASLLLQNINCSLSTLNKLYARSQDETRQHQSTAAVTTMPAAPTNMQRRLSDSSFPPEPTTPEEGDQVVRFFCKELDMGYAALRRWRDRLTAPPDSRWGLAPLRASSSSPFMLQKRRSSEMHAAQGMWFIPREQDVQLVQSAHRDLHTILSPFVTLSPPPRECSPAEEKAMTHSVRVGRAQPDGRAATTIGGSETRTEAPQKQACVDSTSVGGTVGQSAYRPPPTSPVSAQDTSTFYALRDIPAGMFILSIPTDAVFFAQPPPASDPVLSYFMHIEDLIGQLVAAAEDERASHGGYVRYLMQSVVPCCNLPFFTRQQMHELLLPPPPRAPSSTSSAETQLCVSAGAATNGENGTNHSSSHDNNSSSGRKDVCGSADGSCEQSHPAWQLWSFFHEDMSGLPLSPYLRQRLSKEEYAWWVSVVLSRREGAATYIPLVDKLNHDPSPSCYYTMSTPEAFCGLDVLDNLMAGVSPTLLYQPYVHVFTIRNVRAGEPLTLCYASASNTRYTYPARSGNSASPAKSAFCRTHCHDGMKEAQKEVDDDDDTSSEATRLLPPPPNGCHHTLDHDTPTTSKSDATSNKHESSDTNRAYRRGEREGRAARAVYELFGDTDCHTLPAMLTTSPSSSAAAAAVSHSALLPTQCSEDDRPAVPGQHAGTQEVHTAEAIASWKLQWGFVPPCDAVYSASDLQQVAAIVAERRVDMRRLLFPADGKHAN